MGTKLFIIFIYFIFISFFTLMKKKRYPEYSFMLWLSHHIVYYGIGFYMVITILGFWILLPCLISLKILFPRIPIEIWLKRKFIKKEDK